MTGVSAFAIARLPRIAFGAGVRSEVGSRAAQYGRRALLVTGGASLRAGPFWAELEDAFAAAGVHVETVQIADEPSPDQIDAAVRAYRGAEIEVVVAIGGGSALDAGKAIAGLLRPGNSVLEHLEGVGPERPYRGPAVPFVALPTTAGTGSEATKNAVLSQRGEHGYKKSFRDEALVAREALVDPDFLRTCPRPVLAANGMDALTQLLESFVSTRSNPFCAALALDGLQQAREALLPLYEDPNNPEARAGMAYASLLSGICLAQTGLGSVHGLASPLGAFFPIPHGMACGTLVAKATEVNIRALQAREPDNPALEAYATVGRLFAGDQRLSAEAARGALLDRLRQWREDLHLQPLSAWGVTRADHPRIVANSRGSSMKTNPIVLEDEEIAAILND
ncbi:MAG: iron-containing alcohol dehydrogenase [Halochromatium sp.]|uniref:iron-containing alcohol dehydrogenase n=1 Tax=Halochromatium sp. TaxID=2049430 RepID=UPI00397B0B11